MVLVLLEEELEEEVGGEAGISEEEAVEESDHDTATEEQHNESIDEV